MLSSLRHTSEQRFDGVAPLAASFSNSRRSQIIGYLDNPDLLIFDGDNVDGVPDGPRVRMKDFDTFEVFQPVDLGRELVR